MWRTWGHRKQLLPERPAGAKSGTMSSFSKLSLCQVLGNKQTRSLAWWGSLYRALENTIRSLGLI